MDSPAPQETTTTKTASRVRVVPLSFAAVLVCFFFTFVNVSCQGTRVGSLSGTQLAFGTSIDSKDMWGSEKKQKVDPEPLATIALVAGVCGLALSFAGARTRFLTMLTGVAGGGLLLFLKLKMDEDITKQGDGLLQLDYQPAFILAVVLFFVAAVAAYRERPR